MSSGGDKSRFSTEQGRPCKSFRDRGGVNNLTPFLFAGVYKTRWTAITKIGRLTAHAAKPTRAAIKCYLSDSMNVVQRSRGRKILLSLIAGASFFATPALAAVTLTDAGGNVVHVEADEVYAYLFAADADTTMISSNTVPTDFTVGSGDVCAAYGDGAYRVIGIDSYTVCNTDVRTACEADTGAVSSDFWCDGGTLTFSEPPPPPPPDPVCGDTVVEGAEQCDDGNLTDGDGCSAMCEIETETGPLMDAEQYDDILVSGWQLAGDLIRGVWAVSLTIALALALLEYFTRRATQYVRDDKRE